MIKGLPEEIHSMGLKVEDGQLKILDQQKLPQVEEWKVCHSCEEMVEMIKTLKVRGAPLIGVAAAMALSFEAAQGADPSLLQDAAKKLRKSRPTAVNLMWAIDSILPLLSAKEFSPQRVILRGYQIFQEDIELCQKMGALGASLIEDGDSVLTHCNAGGLATAGIGTAIGAIVEAFREGKKIHVYIDETRPLLQGGRLTTYEMKKWGIPYTLICDNMAASLMRKGKIHKIFVGADRIALNGDFANKIGTLSVATNASVYNVPFYTVAPYTTIDWHCETGQEIPIEERLPKEVLGVHGYFGDVVWAPEDAEVFNPAFDVTPRELVTGIVTDRRIFSQHDLVCGKLKELSL